MSRLFRARLPLLLIPLCLSANLSLAEGMDHSAHMAHDSPPASVPAPGAADEAQQMFEAANAAMHRRMDIAYTGDPDVDFVLGMIPHHQGAIDMAQVVLAHGQDPEIRKLAESVITAQQGEIAEMRAWLAARGITPAAE